MSSATEPLIIGLLHPGEMGAAVGRCLADGGHTVLWASEGRGLATADRARAAGLTDAGTPAAVAGQAGIVISVCPPRPRSTSPARCRPCAGCTWTRTRSLPALPARSPGSCERRAARTSTAASWGRRPTRPAAATRSLHDLFEPTRLEPRVVDGHDCSASAVKMAYAAWTKGSAALLLAVGALATAEGVAGHLLAEWQLSQPGLADRAEGAQRSAAAKGWRWEVEMREIAATMAAAGQPGGFHLAAAEIYARHPRPRPGPAG
ncbi:MAG: DUF1932 domain-containing protein [Streptosporangiaceae bacterium]